MFIVSSEFRSQWLKLSQLWQMQVVVAKGAGVIAVLKPAGVWVSEPVGV